MHKPVFTLGVAAIVLTAVAGGALTSVAAHEAHKMKCNETAMNAMKADIQSMPDGEAKANAKKEMDMAEQMMINKDMESCGVHMDSATKAMEE